MTTSSPLPLLPGPHLPDDRGLGGLLAHVHGKPVPLPLREVRVRATIAGSWCRTVVEQTFQNPYDTLLEVIHLFPLPEDGAIVEAELRAGEVVVRAECRERKDAERTFEAARAAGHRAMLVTQERPDVHTLRVTNVPAHTDVTVRLVIVESLDCEDGEVRWRFPTTIAPRYLPGTPVGHEGPGVAADTDHAPDASRLQPPLRLAGGTRLDLEVEIAGQPTSVASSLHAVKMSWENGFRVAPSANTTLDRDFVLAIRWGRPTDTGVRAWTDGTHTLVQVDAPTALVPPALPRDAVFVVDISGSMEGAKIDAARRALTAAVHGLSSGDRFRLLAFDDRVEAFAPAWTAVDDRAFSRADAWIARLAPRGGTEMLPAIQAALQGDRSEGRVETVLFITDGQAHNDKELIAAVAGRARGARFFTFGIDTAVNGALLKRLARVGGGTCTLTTPDAPIAEVVARLEARLGSPIASDVLVQGPCAVPEPGILFAGRPVVAHLAAAPDVVTVQFTAVDGPHTLTAMPVQIEAPLGAMWARARVAWLEDRAVVRPFEEEAIRPEVVRIALAAGIASQWTAFVAVDRSVTSTGTRVEVVQPHELPSQWEGGAGVLGAGGPPGGAPRGRAAPMIQRISTTVGSPAPMAPPAPSRARLQSARDESADDAGIDAMASPVRSKSVGDVVRSVFGSIRGASAAPKAAPPPQDPGEALAVSQSADGSFGGDVARTAAAVLALVLLGHTRLTGTRKRTVQKAAAWLATQQPSEPVRLALGALESAEAGNPGTWDPAWADLAKAGVEGRILMALHAGP